MLARAFGPLIPLILILVKILKLVSQTKISIARWKEHVVIR